MKSTANMPKETNISKAIRQTEDYEFEELAKDSVTFLEAELLLAMKVKGHSAVEAAKWEVFRMTVHETSMETLLESYKLDEEKLWDSSY